MPEIDPWFESIGAKTALSHSELRALQENGFVVTRGPVPTADLTGLARAYDSGVLQADPADVKEGSTTTRVQDFANRGPEFDALYLHAPLLEAKDMFIAGAFPFFNQTRADPPHQGMEPEQRLDQHVNRCEKIVAPPHMTQLMSDQRFELRSTQPLNDAFRQQENWTP